MKRQDHTLLTWFLLVVVLVYVSPLWLPLALPWRIASLSSVFIASFLMILNMNLGLLGTFMSSDQGTKKNRSGSDPKVIEALLEHEPSFRRTVWITAALATVYFVTTITACFGIREVKELFLYLMGWSFICLFMDSQLRLNALTRILKINIETPSDTENEKIKKHAGG